MFDFDDLSCKTLTLSFSLRGDDDVDQEEALRPSATSRSKLLACVHSTAWGHVARGMCVCVVAPASLARHFDDVDLRYFYFSQSSFASLNLAQPPDTVDISHYTGLQHCCLNLPHASLATTRAGKFPTGFRAHSLSHVSISSIRRRESGIDRRHHQSRVTAIRTTTTRNQLCAIHNTSLPLLARIK